MRRNLDLFAAFFVSLLAVGLTLAHLNNGPLGVMIGLLLVFVLPGYIFSIALFPESTWSFMERTILTMGLSLSISVLGGIVLYPLKIPLTPENWALFYGTITLVFGGIAITRRLIKHYPARRKTDSAPESHAHLWPRLPQLGMFALAALIFIGAMTLAQTMAKYYPDTEIVQLWLLPTEGESRPSVRIGAMVNDSAPRQYSLWLQRDGYTVEHWEHLTFNPGERWETVVSISTNLPGKGPLKAYLYRYDQPSVPYRHVILWLNQPEK